MQRPRRQQLADRLGRFCLAFFQARRAQPGDAAIMNPGMQHLRSRLLRSFILAPLVLGVVLAATGCAQSQRGPEVRRLDDAIRECAKTHQRVQLIGPSNSNRAQNSYTNIQDSSGQRQTDVSDPAGNGQGWYRCIS